MIYKEFIRVLYIDLHVQKIHIDERHDLSKYLGGVGVASKLLEENMRPQLSPLDPAQPIVFASGALSTIFPAMSKVVAMFVSPLTGNLGESYAGGRLALSLLSTGFDAVVITGKAKRPTYLSITCNNVSFRDARTLWDSKKENTGRIIRDDERQYAGKRSIIRIGSAGQNLVSYACVTVDRYRHFGRLGLGAVFGSKHLKAIHIAGNRSIPIHNFKEYFKVYRELYTKCVETDLMTKYHDIGTSVNILPLNKIEGLPTRNLQSGKFEDADKVSGEAFAEERLARKIACAGCPVGCIHIGQLRREFAAHGHEYETISVAYDYELIFALGTFLGINDNVKILELIEDVEIAGLDAMSTGVVLGWATEAFQKGLLSLEETLVPLEFGKADAYRKAVTYIGDGINEFYVHLGKGVKHASQIYGGTDYAMHVAGNEMTGYHTGYGSLAGMAVGARHSHLCNGGYSIDQSLKVGSFNVDDMVDALMNEELERCMLNSLVMCLFARKVYNREVILSALNSVGYNLTHDNLTAIAHRTYAAKLRVKKAFGFDLNNIELPKRFFEVPTMHGMLDESVAYEILSKFREKTLNLIENY